MLKNQKYFFYLMKTAAVVSFVNLFVLHIYPVFLPFSSFSIIRNLFIGFATDSDYRMVISMLLCALLFWTPAAISKQKIFLPLLSFLYLIFDILILFTILANGKNNGYWLLYILEMLLSAALLVPLGKYCWNRVGNKPDKKD